MENNVKTLALYLDGPMQSWGCQSQFDRRTTLAYPTKSGVIGMLCAALGIDRSDTTSIASLAALSMKVLCLSQISRWTDYHTVGAGYDRDSDKQHRPRKADGGTRKDAVVSRREYLSDARFGVLLSGDGTLLNRCDKALQDPRWGIWFGRKSCIPASPITQGVFNDHPNAISVLSRCSNGR